MRGEIAALGGIESMVAAMNRYPEDDGVCCNGCLALMVGRGRQGGGGGGLGWAEGGSLPQQATACYFSQQLGGDGGAAALACSHGARTCGCSSSLGVAVSKVCPPTLCALWAQALVRGEGEVSNANKWRVAK